MRTSLAWLLLAGTSVALIAAMAWVTHVSLEVERVNADIQRDMNVQSAARQALWRLDTLVMPMLQTMETQHDSMLVLQTDQKQGITRWTFTAEQNQNILWSHRPAWMTTAFESGLLAAIRTQSDRQRAMLPRTDLAAQLPDEESQAQSRVHANTMQQQAINLNEFQMRSSRAQQMLPWPESARQQMMRMALVVDGRLVFAQPAAEGLSDQLIGYVVDWSALQTLLQQEIRDLLPDAQLKLVSNEEVSAIQAATQHRMAVLPVMLTPGNGPDWVEPESAMRGPVMIAWASLLAAIAAMTLLLAGMTRLSHRRAMFVQAVTHEMRTPLTTFRLYTDLLLQGRVTSPDRQKQYVTTLQREALRLSQMVENVLAYAKLERRVRPAAIGPCQLGVLVDRAWDRLSCRAEQSGFMLHREVEGDVSSLMVQADESLVEQILLNLIDNACKYANQAQDRRIHLRLRADHRQGQIVVEDHGPGVSQVDRAKLFRPFSRLGPGHGSAANDSMPGVGLGLSISRRLAREMGGDLTLLESQEGAAFGLFLRRVTQN